MGGAIEHRNASLRHVHQPGPLDQFRNAGQFGEGTFSRRQMVNSKHRMRFAATECRLKLNNRLATLTGEPLCDLREK